MAEATCQVTLHTRVIPHNNEQLINMPFENLQMDYCIPRPGRRKISFETISLYLNP
jgi:hypothetical protein